MTTQTEILSLGSLEYLPFLDENGVLAEEIQSKIGVYAIFDQEKVLQFVGYSRDMYLSLKQHLIRQPNHCYWIKLQTISRPSRTILEEIRQAWLSENSLIQTDDEKWTQPIDAKFAMSEAEKQDYQNTDEMGKIKLLKKVSRRVEETIQEQLKQRGVQMEIRFNPKLKEEGLLDLKS